jgi:hypothetical protein
MIENNFNTYSIGTKILDKFTKNIYTKLPNNKWLFGFGDFLDISDDIIFNSKRFIIVKEDNFKILSFSTDQYVWILDKDGFFKSYERYMKDTFIINNIYSIDSVKRISDGIVFTKGDKIKKNNIINSNVFSIGSFDVNYNGELDVVIDKCFVKIENIDYNFKIKEMSEKLENIEKI